MESKKVFVSQKAVVSRRDGKILAIRRSKTAPTRPFYWDLPGGGLEYGEDAKKGINREIKEEAGLDVKNLKIFDMESSFDPHGKFWVTLAYKAECDFENIKLSFEHDESKWITPKGFRRLRTSLTLQKFIKSRRSDLR